MAFTWGSVHPDLSIKGPKVEIPSDSEGMPRWALGQEVVRAGIHEWAVQLIGVWVGEGDDDGMYVGIADAESLDTAWGFYTYYGEANVYQRPVRPNQSEHDEENAGVAMDATCVPGISIVRIRVNMEEHTLQFAVRGEKELGEFKDAGVKLPDAVQLWAVLYRPDDALEVVDYQKPKAPLQLFAEDEGDSFTISCITLGGEIAGTFHEVAPSQPVSHLVAHIQDEVPAPRGCQWKLLTADGFVEESQHCWTVGELFFGKKEEATTEDTGIGDAAESDS